MRHRTKSADLFDFDGVIRPILISKWMKARLFSPSVYLTDSFSEQMFVHVTGCTWLSVVKPYWNKNCISTTCMCSCVCCTEWDGFVSLVVLTCALVCQPACRVAWWQTLPYDLLPGVKERLATTPHCHSKVKACRHTRWLYSSVQAPEKEPKLNGHNTSHKITS